MKSTFPCPIRGCDNGRHPDRLVCVQHSVQIWAHVEEIKGADIQVALTIAEQEERKAADRAKQIELAKTHGWIYFLELDDKIKVGWTANLAQRLKSYPPHARMVVEYEGTRADERDLHRTLRVSLVAGREWYARTPQVLECMRDAQLKRDRQLTEEHAARMAALPAFPVPVPSRGPRKLSRSEVVQAQMRGEDPEQGR